MRGVRLLARFLGRDAATLASLVSFLVVPVGWLEEDDRLVLIVAILPDNYITGRCKPGTRSIMQRSISWPNSLFCASTVQLSAEF